MKKLIRLLLKIVTSPFVLTYFIFIISVCYLFVFWAWLGDYSDYGKSLEHDEIKELKGEFKKWFTTV